MARITARKALSALQSERVKIECAKRGVEFEIEDHGAWILVRMSGENDQVAATWAAIRQGKVDGIH